MIGFDRKGFKPFPLGIVTPPFFGVPVGEYLQPVSTQHSVGQLTDTEICYFLPFWAPGGMAADQLAMSVSVGQAGGAVRVGLYTVNFDDGNPDELIVDGGELDLSSSGVKTASIGPVALPEMFFSAVHVKDAATQPTVSVSTSAFGLASILSTNSTLIAANTTPRGISVTAAYGALPAKATSLGTLAKTSTTLCPMIFVRKA